MPSLDDVLRARRMCRDFADKSIDSDQLAVVTAAALRAPSAGNTWALDLLVLQGAAETARYWDTTLPVGEDRESFAWPGLLAADVLVIPYILPGAYLDRYGKSDKSSTGLGDSESAWPVPYWWVDGGAAVMAMLLAAQDQELGALFFGQFQNEQKLRDVFGVPEQHRALGTIALGHPAENAVSISASSRRGRPQVADRVHQRNW